MGGFKEYDRYDGLGKNKLPGIRIEGNHRTRIARAAQLEKAQPWFEKRPPVFA
jgi:hypothetical protein